VTAQLLAVALGLSLGLYLVSCTRPPRQGLPPRRAVLPREGTLRWPPFWLWFFMAILAVGTVACLLYGDGETTIEAGH
jgi:hypothetical protein